MGMGGEKTVANESGLQGTYTKSQRTLGRILLLHRPMGQAKAEFSIEREALLIQYLMSAPLPFPLRVRLLRQRRFPLWINLHARA